MQATISAIQTAYQPCEMPEIFMKIKRQGTNKISCLIAALTILMMPFPVYFGDRETQELCWDKESTVETVVLMSRKAQV